MQYRTPVYKPRHPVKPKPDPVKYNHNHGEHGHFAASDEGGIALGGDAPLGKKPVVASLTPKVFVDHTYDSGETSSAESGKFVKQLTPAEKEAVTSYTMAAYIDANAFERGAKVYRLYTMDDRESKENDRTWMSVAEKYGGKEYWAPGQKPYMDYRGLKGGEPPPPPYFREPEVPKSLGENAPKLEEPIRGENEPQREFANRASAYRQEKQAQRNYYSKLKRAYSEYDQAQKEYNQKIATLRADNPEAFAAHDAEVAKWQKDTKEYNDKFEQDPANIVAIQKATELHQKYNDTLDSALRKGSLSEDTMLYRGLTKLPDGFAEGAIATEPGFSSTSLNKRMAENVRGGEGVTLRIKAPAGTKGGFVSRLSKYKKQAEFVLPRGTRYRVDKIGKDEYGRRIADVTVLPNSIGKSVKFNPNHGYHGHFATSPEDGGIAMGGTIGRVNKPVEKQSATYKQPTLLTDDQLNKITAIEQKIGNAQYVALSPSEQHATIMYVGAGYHEMNDTLRENPSAPLSTLQYSLKSAIEKNSLPEDKILYRGMRHEA